MATTLRLELVYVKKNVSAIQYMRSIFSAKKVKRMSFPASFLQVKRQETHLLVNNNVIFIQHKRHGFSA